MPETKRTNLPWLRQHRIAAGLTARELGGDGIAPSTIYDWEHGRSLPADVVPILARTLGVTPEALTRKPRKTA